MSSFSELIGKAKEFVTDKLADVPKPEASVDDVDLAGVTSDSVKYNAKLSVKNPYSHSIPICEISYSLKSAGKEVASGTVPDPGSLLASATTVLEVLMKVPHNVLVTLAKDITKDWDIDYLLHLALTIDLPVVGNFTIPISSSGEIKLPTLSDIF